MRAVARQQPEDLGGVGEVGRRCELGPVPLPCQPDPRTPGLPGRPPRALYVREDQVVAALDRWLPSLADPDFLAASKDTGTDDDQRASLQRRIDDVDQATRNLLRAIEQGTDPNVVRPRIAELRDDRLGLVSALATIQAPDGRLTSDDIAALLEGLGGMETVLAEAEPRDKAAIYASLGLRLEYRPDQRVVVATADLDCVLGRVGGPTRPLATHEIRRSQILAR